MLGGVRLELGERLDALLGGVARSSIGVLLAFKRGVDGSLRLFERRGFFPQLGPNFGELRPGSNELIRRARLDRRVVQPRRRLHALPLEAIAVRLCLVQTPREIGNFVVLFGNFPSELRHFETQVAFNLRRPILSGNLRGVRALVRFVHLGTRGVRPVLGDFRASLRVGNVAGGGHFHVRHSSDIRLLRLRHLSLPLGAFGDEADVLLREPALEVAFPSFPVATKVRDIRLVGFSQTSQRVIRPRQLFTQRRHQHVLLAHARRRDLRAPRRLHRSRQFRLRVVHARRHVLARGHRAGVFLKVTFERLGNLRLNPRRDRVRIERAHGRVQRVKCIRRGVPGRAGRGRGGEHMRAVGMRMGGYPALNRR